MIKSICSNRLLGFCLLLFYFNVPVSCIALNDSLPASALFPYGRYAITEDGELELISSAVHVGFRFSGEECKLFVRIPDNMDHNYIQYSLDGVYQHRIKISGNNRDPLIIGGLRPGSHTIWIYKATEATTGPIFIVKITAKNILALKDPDLPLIEFIGNSITCGAASDPSETPCGTGEYHDQTNAYYAYGPRVARSLNVNFILSSVSGIGIYRSWNTPGPNMPMVYEKTDFLENSSRLWDFKNFSPRVVSIALGTNDFSDGDGKTQRLPFDSVKFVNNYIQFIQLVKSKYPKTIIALLSSPMINGRKREQLQNCLTAVKIQSDKLNPSDKPVAVYFFEPMQAHGCSGHPDLDDHAILAAELVPFFKGIL